MNHEQIKMQIQASLIADDVPQLDSVIQTLQPYDLAEVLRLLSHNESLLVIPQISISEAAEAIEYLDPEEQYQILHHLDDADASPLLKQMFSDTVVDMLLAIHPLQAERLLRLLPEDYREKINKLMKYPEDTAGSLMTVDYIVARAYWSCEHTIEHIRKVAHEAEIVSYIYVIEVRGELVGVVSLKEIILSNPQTALREIVTQDVISVPAEMEQEEVAGILSRYGFYALPVIDHQHRLIGIITYDDVVEVLQEEATEDFQKLGGSQPLTEPYFKTSVWVLFQKRILWLFVLFIGGSFTATLLDNYQEVTQQMLALSFFVPLLIGTGGNTGSQIVSTMVRALGVGDVVFKDILRVVRKELTTCFFLGICLSFASFFSVYITGIGTQVGLVMALSVLIIVLWTSLVSSTLPLILHRLKLDPAVVSGPLITTVVDGTGVIIYYTVAKALLDI